MLILTRKPGPPLLSVPAQHIQGQQVRIGIQADEKFLIFREKLGTSGSYRRPAGPRASRFGLLVAIALSSLSRPAPLESPGLAFRGLPVQRGERSLDVRLFPPHPAFSRHYYLPVGCPWPGRSGRYWRPQGHFLTSLRHKTCLRLRPHRFGAAVPDEAEKRQWQGARDTS